MDRLDETFECRVPEKLIDEIHGAETFLLMGHQKPDGDAIGSMIAFGKGLKILGKTVIYAVDCPIEPKLRYFEETQYFNQGLCSNYDAAVFLDCSTMDYAFQPAEEWQANKILVIDHHRSNIGFGDVNFIEEAAATAELIYRILSALHIPLDDEMAEALYAGISTDTGQFQYANVTEQTHEILGRLYRVKPSYTQLSKRMHSIKSLEQFKMYGAACQSLTLIEKGKIAWITLPYDVIEANGGAVNITDDIATLPANVQGVMLGVTVKETAPGEFRVSLRSVLPSPVDVSDFAVQYGGGGHFRAAGLTWKKSLAELEESVCTFFRERLSWD